MPRTASELVPEVAGRVIWDLARPDCRRILRRRRRADQDRPREYELAVVRARAAIAQAKTRLATEEQEARRRPQGMGSLGEGEATDLTLRKPQIAEAQASLASAEASLEQAAIRPAAHRAAGSLCRTRAHQAGRCRAVREPRRRRRQHLCCRCRRSAAAHRRRPSSPSSMFPWLIAATMRTRQRNGPAGHLARRLRRQGIYLAGAHRAHRR